MESLDYWRLCDEVSIIQAAFLIIGKDPSAFEGYEENPIFRTVKAPIGLEAAKTAVANAVVAGELPAIIRRDAIMGHIEEHDTEKWLGTPGKRVMNLNLNLTTIKVKDLRTWLSKRGFTNGFFFPQNEHSRPDYLDTQHAHYSPKLAAAIEAWIAVTEAPDSSKKGKSVKKALEIWLRANAGRFGLIRQNGNPNENGIEEVAKVANWATKGGAPKTPVS